MLAWEWLPMTVAGQGNVQHSQISLDAHHPRPRWLGGLAAWRPLSPRFVIAVLAAAFVIAAISLGPKIISSTSRTMERLGNSAEIQGRAGADLMHQTIDTFRSRN